MKALRPVDDIFPVLAAENGKCPKGTEYRKEKGQA
jgi:hypothetical protein